MTLANRPLLVPGDHGDGDSIADFGSSDRVALDLKEIKKPCMKQESLIYPLLMGYILF